MVEEYTVESGVISLPTSQQMSKEGHTFGGWYRTSSLNSTDISAALRTSITSIDSYYGNNLNVYARWILDVDYNISLTTSDTNDLNNIYLIGDTLIDIKTAQNAGIHSVGVTWCITKRETFESANTEYIIDHPSELIKILEE